MRSNLPFVAVAAGILSLAPSAYAASGIFDQTQVLFAAPAYMLPGQTEVPMTHAHLIYLGANLQDPGAPVLEYSYGQLAFGELNYDFGYSTGIYITLERPSAELVPPYHLVGLAVTGGEDEPGGLLIGGSRTSLWDGLDFNSIFPAVDLQEVVTQLRSGNLSGGAIEDLLTRMVFDGATLQSPDPMPVPENPGGPFGLLGWVWGFDRTGGSVELGAPLDPEDPNSPTPGVPFYIDPLFGMFPTETQIIPESAAAPGVLAGLVFGVGGWRWRKRR